MILAAGFGSRLRPLTDQIPKALVTVGGVPMLELVAGRLARAGVDRIIINVHHHADAVEQFARNRGNFGVEVLVSDEREAILDTGGALVMASPLFRRDAPFILHNVDILSDINIAELYHSCVLANALSALAVNSRESGRHLLFDDLGLVGYGNDATGSRQLARPVAGAEQRYAFCGIHVISPRIFDVITEEGPFSIIDLYLRLSALGEKIVPHDVDGRLWIDIGRPEQLERARATAAMALEQGYPPFP